MSNVSGIIKSIQDIMRKDVGVDGDAQRIGQLVWMFFLKIFDDREAELELIEDDYKSPLPEHLRWRNWAQAREGITGEALMDFVNNQLFPTLQEKLITHGPTGERARVIRSVFEDAYNYMKSGTLMRQVINKICEIDFNNTSDRHTFGSIYEQILRDLQSAGNAGEFYTPRALTRFIVNRVDPKLDEIVLDPACGTGGFLTCTIDHKREQYRRTKEDEETLVKSIRGVEKKALPHMLAVTNMILHGMDTPTSIKRDNTLARPYKDYGNADRVHVIVTNPPFGGMEEDGIENNFPAHLRTRETADLFMALIIKLLRDGGRAAVILPDGFLFGEGMKTRLKQSLLEECNLHTIVRLPNGVFNPYTGIKTNLLFFTKGRPTEHVWYYEHPYPEGVASYNKSKPMRFEEFENELKWWGNEADNFAERVQTQQAWKVPAADLIARKYNLDIKNPHVGEQVSHDLDNLLSQYQRQQSAIAVVQNQLRDILRETLRGKAVAIANHLDIWTSAVVTKSASGKASNEKEEPYGVKKLRELILKLAVHGKLVPQDPNAEPAQVLLERISKGKERLIKEGAIGREKPLPEISNEEKPYELPAGWIFVRLGNVAFPQAGFAFKSQFFNQNSEGLPLIRIRDVGQPFSGTFHSGEYREEFLVEKGDYLISMDGEFRVSTWVNGRALLNQRVARLIFFHKEVAQQFIAYSLHARLREFQGIKAYTTVDHLSGTQISESVIGLPPLAEQRRIVEKIDELMTLCDSLMERFNHAQTIQVQFADAIVEQAAAQEHRSA